MVENRGVSVEEAKWLLMALQKFYAPEVDMAGSETDGKGDVGMAGEEVKRRRELLRMFSEGSGKFDVQELIKEVERIN